MGIFFFPPHDLFEILYCQGNGIMMYCAISNVFWLLLENNDQINTFLEIDWGIAISSLVFEIHVKYF